VTFLADEGVDRQIVDRLRLDGYQVAYVAEMSPGIMDEAVLAESRNSASVLITADNDFGELIFRNGQVTTGVILIRLLGLSSGVKATLVSTAIREHAEELPGAFAVLTAGTIRIRRKLPA
jgi:predicted nuclease of predicted toxin-antitoxin system